MSNVNCKSATSRVCGLGGVKAVQPPPPCKPSLENALGAVWLASAGQNMPSTHPIARHGYGVTSQPPFLREIHQ